MAVMAARLGNLTAWVSIDGVAAECYAPEESEDGMTVTCWIESQAGKKFAVNWSDDVQLYSTEATVTVDGGNMVTGLLTVPHPTGIRTLPGFRTSETTVQPFTFSNIKLTDDEAMCLPSTSAESIGEIKVVLHRTVITGESVMAPTMPRSTVNAPIYERSKKAGVHRMAYGEEEVAERVRFVRTQRYEMVGTFIFRYTSIDILRANDIAPRPRRAPTPPRTTNQGNTATNGGNRREPDHEVIEILSDDEEPKPRKRKSDVKMEPGTKRVKREPEAGPSRIKNEVIDLTL